MLRIIPMANAAFAFDKYSVIQKLQKGGFTHVQAESIADVLANPDASALATKADLQTLAAEVQKQMYDLKVSLIQWMVGIQLGYGALIVAVLALQ